MDLNEEIKNIIDKILSLLEDDEKEDLKKELTTTYIKIRTLKEIAKELDL